MAVRDLQEKLAILSDAAKYDASCASSGTVRRDSRDGKGLGSTEGSGICHAYAPDGRCISLLKILMTNFCIYDCAYCVNRVSSNVKRARFTPDEVVELTLEFYRRNYIEGLFLSSGIIRSPDETMERMVRIARTLRETHGFKGYIHLKTIPDADPALIEQAGLHADRVSMNIEMPTDAGVKALAPEKDAAGIRRAMAGVRRRREGNRERSHTGRRPPRFAPAGQSTQMIVGADASTDTTILGNATRLYSSYGLKRVYYSAFSPIPDSSVGPAPRAPAPDARTPALSGGLAPAVLWLRSSGLDGCDRAGTPAPRHRPEARLGARQPAPLSGGGQPRRAGASAARSGSWNKDSEADPDNAPVSNHSL